MYSLRVMRASLAAINVAENKPMKRSAFFIKLKFTTYEGKREKWGFSRVIHKLSTGLWWVLVPHEMVAA